MRIGVFLDNSGANGSVDAFVETAAATADRGFRSLWTPQVFGLDALTAIAVAGREVGSVTFGTAVVPTYPRHPMVLAAQARTTALATDGRLVLGIGLSHQVVIEGMYGYSFEKPARHMREYLSVLLPMLRDSAAAFEGETLKGFGQIQTAAAPEVPVVLAGLGPVMLTLAGAVADGTVTWMTGPKTVGEHIAPRIAKAAAEAGRDAPRVVVALPVAVTDDPDGARAKAAKVFAMYGNLPSYRAMLDREGVDGPADVIIAGSEDVVRSAVEEVFEQGATEFVAVPFDDRDRTLDALASLL